MTEREWMTCSDPMRMLEFARDRIGERKLRLFACACCRNVWGLLPEDCRRAVETGERFADGRAGVADLEAAARALARPPGEGDADEFALEAARAAVAPEGWEAATGAFEAAGCAAWVAGGACADAGDAEFLFHCRLLRDLLGDSLDPRPALDPSWPSGNGEAVRKLARDIYDGNQFGDLRALADALEAAGCKDRGVLEHCRRPGDHVRGCWVVDLVLANE